MLTYQTNGSMASQGIYTNTPTRLRHILPPDSLLLNNTHPDPGNKWWVLLNMARSHRKTNYKVSTRVKNYCQRSPRPTETTTSYIIRGKCDNFSDKGREKWGTPTAICINWKYIFWPYWEIYSSIIYRWKLYPGSIPLWYKQNTDHTT